VKYCTHCGEELPAYTRAFCPSCGGRVDGAGANGSSGTAVGPRSTGVPSGQGPSPAFGAPHWAVWVVIGLLVLAAVGAGLYFGVRGNDSDTAIQGTLTSGDMGVSTTSVGADSVQPTTVAATTASDTSGQQSTPTSQTTTTVKLVGQLQTQMTLELLVPVTRYEETDYHLKWSGNWLADTSPKASAGAYKVTMGANPSVLVRFQGTGISLVSLKCTTAGIAKLTLDGLVYFVDLYSKTASWQTVWSSPTLTSGVHELKVEWSGSQNQEAQGSFIAIDAFDVEGSLLTP
jgi:hypothetical protein